MSSRENELIEQEYRAENNLSSKVRQFALALLVFLLIGRPGTFPTVFWFLHF